MNALSRLTTPAVSALLALALAGCLPPPASVFVRSAEDVDRIRYSSLTTEDGSYIVGIYYTAGSLNVRLARPDVGRVRVHLRDGTRKAASGVVVAGDTLRYTSEDEYQSVPLSAVDRLLIRERYTTGMAREELSWTVPFYGGLGLAFGTSSAVRDGNPEDAAVGALIGGAVGVAVGLLQSRSHMSEETVLFNGYEFIY